MPTGYTSKLVEKGQTLEEFAMTCARAFGALAGMRDDPLSATIPETIKINDYHLKELYSAKKRLAKIKSLGEKEIIRFCARKRNKEIKKHASFCKRKEEEHWRITKMIDEVNRWKPRRAGPIAVKRFMLEQLEMSLEEIYIKELVRNIDDKTMIGDEISQLEQDIAYHSKKYEEEIERNKNNNQWLADLRTSLKSC